MDTEKILIALEERDRWKGREQDIQREIEDTPKGLRKEKQVELERIREQVTYYEALARDMRKIVKPSKLPHLLSALLNL